MDKTKTWIPAFAGMTPFFPITTQSQEGRGAKFFQRWEKGILEYNRIMFPRLVLILLFLFPTWALAAQRSPGDLLDYTLNVSFDIQASQIRGQAKIAVRKGQELRLQKGNLHILAVIMDKQRMDFADRIETLDLRPSEDGFVEIRYVATFKSVERPGVEAGASGAIPTRVIDQRGIFLNGIWYPQADQMCNYHLTVTLPAEYEAVSEADSVTSFVRERQKIISFDFSHPLDSLTLIATNRYQVTRERSNDTEILAYFFPEDGKLARNYIDHAKKYLRLYEGMVGKYPYQRFCIVENFLPTGNSMPTYTLLGQDVVRLPFIVETSLGHEVLHQWFGDSVYVDYGEGNWAEGLTTCLADHLYEEQKGKGFEYRKGALVDYQSYVRRENEISLKNFRGRVDRSSQAIGYGKAFLVFHMLEDLIGQERFFDSLKYFVEEMRFRPATWQDLRAAFEKVTRRDLRWFFRQWVDEKGIADLSLGDDIKVRPRDGKFEVQFTVVQKKKVFSLQLPVSFYSAMGKVTHLFPIDKEKNQFSVLLADWPYRMVIDEDYDLARTLSQSEFPPVIARLIGGDRPTLVLPPSGEKVYQAVIEHFKKMGARMERAEQANTGNSRTASLVILGDENPLAKSLFGHVGSGAGFDLTIKENPWNPKEVIGVFHGKSGEEVEAAFPKIFHYGKYSEVAFDRGRNVLKILDPSSRGMVRELAKPAAVVEVSGLKNLAGVIRQVDGRKIIYVGEAHDRFSHHVVQLEVIKALKGKERKVAIGMEMFPRPFQKDLDDYVSGQIDEKEFLRKTEYLSRWRFDYNLYRPILQFARSEKIPVVALNIQTEIVEKVARGGLDSLSDEEKKSVPAQMDFSDGAYRERLRKIFQEHKDFPGNFDFFYQAQVLWDETMAKSIDDFLKKSPEYQMVVLAGTGHLAFGSGIPKRAARRNGYDYAIRLNDVDLEKDVADYVLYPGPIPIEESPKLGVFLAEEKGQVVIQGFSEGSAAEKAGIQKGDIILSLDQTPIHNVNDARLEILFKKRGEPVKVKILRKEPAEGEKEMEFGVSPQ